MVPARSAPTVAGTTGGASAARRRAALATLCGVLFLTFLDTTIVSVGLADVQGRLHADVAQLQWVVNGYALPFASLMLAFGSLGDRLGRKRVLLGGLTLFVAGALLSALAPSTAALIAGRALMGAGAAASEPGTLSMIRHVFPDVQERAHALGAWAAVCGLALALGPVIGGALVGLGGFRALFWFSAGAGVVALGAAARQLPAHRGSGTGRFDVPGMVAVTTALGAAAFAIIQGESAGYRSPGVVALFVVAAVAVGAFLAAERRAANPLLDLGFLRSAPFAGSLVVAFALFFGIFSIFFFTALYLQVVVGLTAYRTAVEFAAMALAMLAGSAAGGFLVSVAGPRLPMTVGCVFAGAGMIATDAVLSGGAAPDRAMLAAALAAAGLGFGLGVVPVTAVALEAVPPEHSGMAASATNTARELGAVMSVAVLGALVDGHLTAGLASRLHALGIPGAFQAIVVQAVETGQVPRSTTGAEQTYGAIVTKVVHAAYGAFQSGLEISLAVAGTAILAAAAVSLAAPGRRRPSRPESPTATASC